MHPPTQYRFSFGPWNISEGADVFGPDVRASFPHEAKFLLFRKLGFEGVQFHDDDVVPNLDGLTAAQILHKAGEVKAMLANQGLVPEFVAPRLWLGSQTIGGAYTSNSAADRDYAWERTRKAIEIARTIGCGAIVLWLSREGTYIREAKDARLAYQRLLEVLNQMLDFDPTIQIWIEPKPNEPTDHAYVPTIGHAIALAYASHDHLRVKGLMESAYALLAGLDPSDEMAFALAHNKLGSVHLNDQNGPKYDQDKTFGGENLRVAFNQVRVLEEYGYGQNGEFVGLDVKAMRTQSDCPAIEHLKNSRTMFLYLVEKVRSLDRELVQRCRDARDYEALEFYILRHLLGVK
ncbi:MAG: TIM barrel protein [Verrucomicrobiota bacterium]|jgi:xylose isomerase